MIRVAVIGAGVMGRNHARIYADIEHVQLVGVMDTNIKLATEVGSLYGLPTYSCLSSMLMETRPHAVSVANPASTHCETTITALNAGAHVLVEKPIATSVSEAIRMSEEAECTGKILMVGHILRFDPLVKWLRTNGRSEVGEITRISIKRKGPKPSRISDVGIVLDLATHDIDFLRHFLKTDPVRVTADIKRDRGTTLNNFVSASFEFENNVHAAIELDWNSPHPIRQVTVDGTNGSLFLDFVSGEIRKSPIDQEFQIRIAMQNSNRPSTEPLKDELLAFTAAIRNRRNPPVTALDGLLALKWSLGILRSSEIMKSVNADALNECCNSHIAIGCLT